MVHNYRNILIPFLCFLFTSSFALSQSKYLLSWTDGKKVVLNELTKTTTGAFQIRNVVDIPTDKRIGNTAVIANFNQGTHASTYLYYNYVGTNNQQLISKLTISPGGQVQGEKLQTLKPVNSPFHIFQVWESDTPKRFLFLSIGTDQFNAPLNASGDIAGPRKLIFNNSPARPPIAGSISTGSFAGLFDFIYLTECEAYCDSVCDGNPFCFEACFVDLCKTNEECEDFCDDFCATVSFGEYEECLDDCLDECDDIRIITRSINDNGGGQAPPKQQETTEPRIALDFVEEQAVIAGKQDNASQAQASRLFAYRLISNLGKPNQKSRIVTRFIDDTGNLLGTPNNVTNFATAPFAFFNVEIFQSVAISPDGTFVVYTVYSPAFKRYIIKLNRLDPITGKKIGGPILVQAGSRSGSDTVGAFGLNIWLLAS